MANFDIEAYLDGALNPAEQAAFEAEMLTNPEFAQEVRLMRQLTGDLESQLLREHVTKSLRDSRGKKKPSFWIAGIALILLFCAAGYFLLLPAPPAPALVPPSQEPTQQRLPPESGETPQNSDDSAPKNESGSKPHIEPIAGVTKLPSPRYPAPNIRGDCQQDTALSALLDKIWYMEFPPKDTRFVPPFDEAGRLLQARDFSKAYIRLELLERSKPDNDTLRFLKGYCLLELGQGKEALRYFDAAAEDKAWAAHREWYRALALLISGQKEAAADGFKAINNHSGHLFQKQASKALKILK